jgi:cell division protein FtsB
MPRRIKKKQSLLAPAGNLLKRLSNTKARSRRKVVRFSFWALVIFLVYSFMSGTYGIPRIVRLELEKRDYTTANRELMAELIDSDRVRDMLKNDPAYIEEIARTRYHMAYPNETIYRYHGQ